MFKFMMDHPRVIVGTVVIVASCLVFFAREIIRAQPEPTIFCTGCGNSSYQSDMVDANEAWSCPICGMDESGLVFPWERP